MTRRSLRSALLVVAAVVSLGAIASLNPGNAGRETDGTPAVTPAANTPPPPRPPPGSGFLRGLPTVPFTRYVVPAAAVALVAAFLYLFVRTDAVASAASATVAAFTGALAALTALVSGGDAAPADGDESTDSTDLHAVGRSAGEAADRIEAEAPVTNEVFRAWYEMTRQLDVRDPATTAPDEFEARAIETGMDPDDVARLTTLFEEVRYGERDPDSREERAVAALRRIETAYRDGAKQ